MEKNGKKCEKMRKIAKKTLKMEKKREKQVLVPDFAVKRSFDTGLTTI